MKILMINNYHFRKGGADAVYFNTAELLKQNGHDVYYFSAKSPDTIPCETEKYFANGHNFRKLSIGKKISSIPSFIYNRDAYDKLLILLDEIKPDLVHIHLFMGGLTSSILTAIQKKNIPVVHSVHDYRLICPAYLFMDGKNMVCEKCIDKFYLRCTFKKCSENKLGQSAILSMDAYFRKYVIKPVILIDRFIFVSRFIKKKHIEFDPSYNIKGDMLYNFKPDLKSIVPTTVKGKYFLYLGRISREKGVHTLFESALKAGISLKIVGTGPIAEQLMDRHSENVEFLGYKSGDELWSLVRLASFIVVPSEWYENNPLTIIEAYSFGKPVIGSRIGGIPEIIEENKTGYLFNPGNESELEAVLKRADSLPDEEYQVMSMNARALAEKLFNPETHYNELIRIYNDVIQNKN
ncbi:MAG: glycosyltransferase [Bacteroidales bacterium]|nr:glycosyltransferase [Bacteroidales bacterium]